jgi:glycosyltransferase involved in cell wall biosynthesis
LIRRTHALIAVSEDACENHLQHFPCLRRGRCRVITISNGIQTDRFSADASESTDQLRGRLGLDKDVKLIGFLGRFMEQKGFLVLVDALDRLVSRGAPSRFHLAAFGSDDYIREYKAEVDRRPKLKGVISFCDKVPNTAPILRQLDLLVMPSLWEACPLLPMEAMVAGTPVLGSDCIGLREVLRGTPSKMAPAGDAEAWSTALSEAIASPWKEEAQAYCPTARSRFDVAHAAERLRGLFDQYAQRDERKDRCAV